MKDMLQDENFDLRIVGGDFLVGESEVQEVANILTSMQGNFKSSPLIGPNLTQLMMSNVKNREIRSRVKIHLAMDNKNYDDMKQIIHENLKWQ